MSGLVCEIIIRGNRTQANARSAATAQIVAAMTATQMTAMINLLDGIGNSLAKISNTKLHLDQSEGGESGLLVAAEFAIAAAQSICDLAYEFLTPAQQNLATELMQKFNEDSDLLLEQIVSNPDPTT